MLLCDEPLLSLDLSHQRSVSELIDERRRATRTAVLFVTHEINPIMDKVDRVLYLANGRFRIGTPAEVMCTEVLSDLYQAHVEVVTVAGRLMVLGVEQEPTPPRPRGPRMTGDATGLARFLSFTDFWELLPLVTLSLAAAV